MDIEAFRQDIRNRLSTSYDGARQGMGLPTHFQEDELEEDLIPDDPKAIKAEIKANKEREKALKARLQAAQKDQMSHSNSNNVNNQTPMMNSEWEESSYFTPNNTFDSAATNSYSADADTFADEYQDDLGDPWGDELEERNDPISVKSMRNILKFARPEQISDAINKMDSEELNHFLSNLQQDAIEVLASKVDNSGDVGMDDPSHQPDGIDGETNGPGGNLELADL